MGMRAAVAGASGYAGGELLRLLLGHPTIEIGPVCAGSQAGTPLGAVHPQLPPLHERVLAATDPRTLAEADVVFLALPHGQSGALAAQLPPELPVVDLGADHRLVDADQWERFYGSTHAGTWRYGLPELPAARAGLTGAARIANPGCYPTTVALALVPLLAAGLIERHDLVVVAASGTSGAGRDAKAALSGSEVIGDVSAYKVGVHQHTPEMVQVLGSASGSTTGAVSGRTPTLSFTPVLAPMSRGMLSTCSAPLRSGATIADLRETLRAAYAEEPFVHLLADGQWPHTAATAGSNACHLQVTLDADAGRATVIAALDNLGKGASGQAVQNANLLLGLPETSGLSANGVAP